MPKPPAKPLRYDLYIDDSGQAKSLVDWQGKPIDDPKLRPFAVVAGVLVADARKPKLLADWLTLKARIRDELGLTYLPSIHMRLMWGRTLPPLEDRASKLPNPYLKASFQQICDWLEMAFELVHRHSTRGQHPLVYFEANDNNHQRRLSDQTYFSHPVSLAERQNLWKHSKDMYRRFHNVVTNPMVGLLASVVFEANLYARRVHGHGGQPLHVVFDRNPDAKGFDLLDALQGIQRLGHLSKLGSIVESHTRQDVLLEVADFHAYWINRIKQLEYERRHDIHMDGWLRLYDFNCCNCLHTLPAPRQADLVELKTMLHFDLGRAAMAAQDLAFVNAEVLTAQEFHTRMRLHSNEREKVLGYPMLRSSPSAILKDTKMAGGGTMAAPSEPSIAERLGLWQGGSSSPLLHRTR
ncbi:DUF3800 domain-containing protein [Deinococcus budaensis]|uniref:DUF3800 domain-containing protein n=1 Tax=Deinococcus budaensis TaxID=1665626 RepID=A0A7W8GEE2_9DEIO|nr:DUF3800 domain-containing protein [Deinococcus budaensis]MBB5234107.1 hypothetical protein [Deinococcus budaensis]